MCQAAVVICSSVCASASAELLQVYKCWLCFGLCHSCTGFLQCMPVCVLGFGLYQSYASVYAGPVVMVLC